MAIVKSNKNRMLRVVGVREAARLCGASPAHVWYIRHGQRKSARFERKMLELGLKFKEVPRKPVRALTQEERDLKNSPLGITLGL